jgi:diguanylate cyclase (GGDEF)-like protein
LKKTAEAPSLIWGLELSRSDLADLRAAVGDGYTIVNKQVPELPIYGRTQSEEPFLLIVPSRVWNRLPDSSREALSRWDGPSRVLLQNKNARTTAPDDLVSQGFLTTLRRPLVGPKVSDVIYRALEVKSLYDDIYDMTREIILERELLSRKTDQLMFLNRLLARATQSLDPGEILVRALQDMRMLAPFSALQAVLWEPEDLEPEMQLHLSRNLDETGREEWTEELLAGAEKLLGRDVGSYTVTELPDGEPQGGILSPLESQVTLMPMQTAGEHFGIMAISMDDAHKLDKDQIQTIRAALNHLVLAMKNAQLYRQVRIKAEYDGLTRLNNRQSFEDRLMEELQRSHRYGFDLSLMLIDLDHFKRINDLHGHQAGDYVLREVGALLTKAMRKTDMVARYGGEEFVIILPHTSEGQAWALAERLRLRIAAHRFAFAGKAIKVTSSIGVTAIGASSLTRRDDLLRQADAALYQAKSGGRNLVCICRDSLPDTAEM